jgi:hypothetical protein
MKWMASERQRMKRDILRDAQYKYIFDRDMYVNRNVKKGFSLEFVDDKPEEELIRRIAEDTDPSKWTFYFNSEASEGIRRELERVLG